MSRVLVVTNDFPPRPGGIQTFVHELVRRMDPSSVVVYTSKWRGYEAFDQEQPFEVIREDTSVLLPTPRVRRRAAALMRTTGCDAALFGAAAPLGLMAHDLRRAGASRIVALTHGHEAGWAQLPLGRQVLRKIGERVDHVTYLGEYTRRRIANALTVDAAERMVQLTPGVDTEVFRPDAGGPAIRQKYGLTGRKVVVCVSRLMPRKGQDTLIGVLPKILKQVPEAALLIVGGGPYRKRLDRFARDCGHHSDIVFTGSVPWEQLPAHYAAGDVFAMPCRTRRGGLDVEGLGIVYLEASATGLPVIAGKSGGAPDAVLDGQTGYVVDGRRPESVASRICELLHDGDRAQALGERGRSWATQTWSWRRQSAALDQLLGLSAR